MYEFKDEKYFLFAKQQSMQLKLFWNRKIAQTKC